MSTGNEAVGQQQLQQPNMHQAMVCLVQQAKRLNMFTVNGIGAEWSEADDPPMKSGKRFKSVGTPLWVCKRRYQAKMIRKLRELNFWYTNPPTTPKLPAAAAASPPKLLENALTLSNNMVESYKATEIVVDQLMENALSLYANQYTNSQMHRSIQLVQQLEIETNEGSLQQLLSDLELEYDSDSERERERDGALVVAAIVNMNKSSQSAASSTEKLIQSSKDIPNFCQIMTDFNCRFKHHQALVTYGDGSQTETQLIGDKIRARCQRNIDFYQMMIVAEIELMSKLTLKEADGKAAETAAI